MQDNKGLQLRVKVSNTGSVALNRVRARISVEDGFDHWLRIRHDNEPPYTRSQNGEVLPADSSYNLYFDVAWSGKSGTVGFDYADEQLRSMSQTTGPRRNLTIEVWGCREDDGKSVVPVTEQFIVMKSNNGEKVVLKTITESIS